MEEEIEKELEILEIQFMNGDWPQPEYERMKAELERRLEKEVNNGKS